MVCGQFGTSSVKPTVLSLRNALDAKAALCRSLAAKLLSSPGVLGAALGSVSRKQHRLKVLHSEDFSPKHHNDNPPYGLQNPSNSGQPTTSEILFYQLYPFKLY